MSIILDENLLPKHVAIIMDGNGRWAQEMGQPRIFGHNAGMQALREIVRHSSDIGIKYLTVYAFSTENWKRPEDEVSGIFKLLVKYVQSELEDLNKNNVKINILGEISDLPKEAKRAAKLAEKTTANNKGLVFNIAINYGGRAEIARAASKATLWTNNRLKITEQDISNELYTANMPDPDVIIRTGGEYRISNFMLWQAAYAELVFTDVLWPDFTPDEYDKCLLEFEQRDRRYGGVK